MRNRVHPDLQSSWDSLEIMDFGDLPGVRQKAREAWPIASTDSAVDWEDRDIPGLAGEPKVRIRQYRPKPMAGPLPGVLWIHGGGYEVGSLEDNHDFCIKMAMQVGAIVIQVDYRLAPEHPYPAALADVYQALNWMQGEALRLGLDSHRIAVAGGSAGGGLAAAIALLARDRGGPPICFQMLLYPMLDPRNLTPSSYEVTDPRTWCRKHNLEAWSRYLGRREIASLEPYAAPALAPHFFHLPPTYIMVGALDLFRDEDFGYAQQLAAAQVPVEFHLYPGAFHAFEFIAPEAPISRRAQAEYMGALTLALRSPSS